ncbi:MAG: OmpA family protein, partial [Pseudomonadota bacterium]
MSFRILACATFAVAAFASAPATAQTALTEEQIIESIRSAPQAADAVIDVDATRAQALARIQAEANENAVGRLPLLENLEFLAKITVEVNFALDSDVIAPASWPTVGLIADALSHPVLLGTTFVVIGHTDATGTREYNLELSQRRADAVVEMLTTTFNVPAERLRSLGLGEEQLQDA